jgi:formylglycine-generating enzyme required for sulfatase activity
MKDDLGGPISHGGFNGEMSKYETTNAQYCEFLNAALDSNDITVGADNIVYGASGSNGGEDFAGEIYFDTYQADPESQITYSGGSFSVRICDGYDVSNHPVVEVSWYGAAAFCNYYGYKLPTEWQWQAVADYDGSYTYGCGATIGSSRANYNDDNPFNFFDHPHTTPVNYYETGERDGPYGYGMSDMAGNVWEWTNTVDSGSSRVIRGGWSNIGSYCTVSYRYGNDQSETSCGMGFRVCRNVE